MSKIKMVVFDMAGTTIKDENEVEQCFVKAAEKTNLSYTREEIVSMMGWSKRLVFETLWKKNLAGESETLIQSKTDESYAAFKEVLEHHYQTENVIPVAGVEKLFSELKARDIKVVLTTGFYREVTNIILNRLGWDKDLDASYCGNNDSIIDLSISSDQVEKGRPAPDMIQRAMQTFNITNSKEVLKIGDTPSDLAAGKNAKCAQSLGVVNGTHSKLQLEQYDNDGLLNSVVDILQFLN